MAATPLAATTRYFIPGTRAYDWLPAVASITSPTRAEINAGTDLTGQVAAVNGFEILNAVSDGSTMGGLLVVQIPGIFSVTDPCEIIFYADTGSADVRTVLPRGTMGFLVFLPEGDVSGRKCEVWPATVRTMYLEQAASEGPGEIHVQFAITSMPAQNVTIP